MSCLKQENLQSVLGSRTGSGSPVVLVLAFVSGFGLYISVKSTCSNDGLHSVFCSCFSECADVWTTVPETA